MRTALIAVVLLLWACSDGAPQLIAPAFGKACAPGQVKRGAVCPVPPPADTGIVVPPDTTPDEPAPPDTLPVDTVKPPPVDTTTSTADIAFTNFDNASVIPLPFTTGDEMSGNANVFVAPNPFGAGRVVAMHFQRPSTAYSADVNRSVDIDRMLAANMGLGKTFYMAGDLYLPTPQAHMTTAMRKLFYIKSGGTAWMVLKVSGGNGVSQNLQIETNGFFAGNLGPVPFNTWVHLELRATVNSAPGVADGVIEIWRDGVRVFIRTNHIHFPAGFTGAYKEYVWGQQTQKTAADLFDEWRYWDNLALSARRVGP
jgi:hypothetical protein